MDRMHGVSDNSYLDNNYRIAGDRFVSERTYLAGTAGQLVADLLPVSVWMFLLTGAGAGTLGVVAAIQSWHDSFGWGEFVWCGLGALLGAFFGIALAPLLLYVGVPLLVYWWSESVGLAVLTFIAFLFIGHRWDAIASGQILKLDADPSRPWVGRSVKIFAALSLGTIVLCLVLVVVFVRPESPAPNATSIDAPAQVKSPAPRAVVLVKTSGKPQPATIVPHNAEAATVAAPEVEATAPSLSTATIAELEGKAARGEAPAESELGVRYLKGQGVTKSYANAADHFQRAAQMHDARSLTNLGWMLTLGQGISRDDAKALDCFKTAADQGNPAAQDSLGFMYEHGRGVPTDLDIAASWYRRAANQGFAKSIANLQRLSQQ